MNLITKIRIILWLGLALLTGWLLYMAVAPNGRISYVYDFKKENYFIRKLTPAERVKPPEDGSQKIIGDPIYFALRTPRTFNKAKLTLKFRNSDNLPFIEAGVLADKKVWRYQTRPIDNRAIDGLAKSWPMISANGIILLQRNKKYDSVGEFLKSPPPDKEIALYNYDLNRRYLLPGYGKSDNEKIINFPLRGAYQFYTYVKNENLDFNFIFVDLNKNKDSDPVEAKIYAGARLIEESGLPDDGVTTDNGKASGERGLKINLPGLEEGVYKVELAVNDDIVTKKIITGQSKLAFINRIWLAEGDADNIILYTDSQAVNAQTINPAKLQNIQIGSTTLAVSATYRQFSRETEEEISEIRLAKDDTIISGDGVFSFSRESLINPNLKRVVGNFNPDKRGVNYILADYAFPRAAGDGWQVAEAEFDLAKAYREFYKYSFLISVPGLRAEDEIDDSLEISEIRIDLAGTSLLEKIKKIFKD